MAEIRYKFDYKEPENIKSEVPGEQNLREGIAVEEDSAVAILTLDDDDKVENYVLAPVVTITKNEATYTKGDMKLQKVSVSENISAKKNDVAPLEPDSALHSDVIHTQPIRMDGSQEERKTRIPTRFKQAAERVRRERSENNRSKEDSATSSSEVSQPNRPRRSSIPRLKTKRQPKQEEDEFDKIYGEIVDGPVDIDVSLLNNKVDDPVKVEDRFEEIIHDYDAGKIRPISINDNISKESSKTKPNNNKSLDRPVKKSVSVDKSVPEKRSTERTVNTDKSNSEKSKPLDRLTSVEKVMNAQKQASTEKRKSIDKTPSLRRSSVDKSKAVDKNVNVERATSVEKPKTRIPMFKRKSEPEIEVPETLQTVRSINSGNRAKVQDVSKISTDEELKTKRIPTRIAVSKKTVVDNDKVKATYQRTISKGTKDGEKYEVQVENVNIKMSYESDVKPENIIKVVHTPESPEDSVIHSSTVEIVDVTPPVEIEPNEIEETIIVPGIVEVIDAPHTAPISQNNQPVYIQEVFDDNPTVSETKHEKDNIEQVSNIKLSPIKVVPVEEFNKITKELKHLQKNIEKPVTLKTGNELIDDQNEDVIETVNSNDNIANTGPESIVMPVETINLEGEPITYDVYARNDDSEIHNNNNNFINTEQIEATPINKDNPYKDQKKDNSTDEIPVLKGKVSKMISRLGSRDGRDEPKKEIVEDLPKPKSVLSKIAMFERPDSDVMPKPKIRNFKKKVQPGPENELEDYKPKIVNEVLKPIARKSSLNNVDNKDYNGKTIEPNFNENQDDKTNKIEVVNIENVAINTPIISDVLEEIPVISEMKPNNQQIRGKTPEAINGLDETPKFKAVEKKIENTNEIVLRPVEIEIEEATPGVYEQNVEEFKVDNEIIVPDDGPSQFDIKRKKELTESPFDFRPKPDSHRVTNYDEHYHSNETPSLDYVMNKLTTYKSSFDDSNLKKSKSMAELDLGDAVKGKVQDMIVRMKSVDRIGVEKREVISVKERPRKKSVSEKIALFEGKLSVSSSHNTLSRSYKSVQKTTEQAMSPEELHKRVTDLSSAKLTFGRMTNMTYIVLGNGVEMPVLSIGTALLDKQLTPHVVGAAIDMGYRAIDTAYVYGNEKEVGEGIRAKIEDGTVRREDLFIINKLWSTFHRQDLVERACRRSLEIMGLDYFDMYLVHSPMSFKEGNDPIPRIASVIQYSEHDYLDAWYGMEELAVQGIVRSIGVSNFNSVQVQRVLDRARIKPVVNMVECHPYLSQQRLDDFCSERNVKLFCYGVLGSKGTPLELKGSTAVVIDDPLVQVMAAGLGVTPAQLLIRYQIESGHAVVTKASSAAHLWDNLQAMTFGLADAQVDALRALNRNKRAFTFKGMGDTHKNYPFNIAF